MTEPKQSDRPHALYRFYGSGGTLLYIGITADLPVRLHTHRDEKSWWLGVANVTVEHYPTRESVLEAERRAILAEKPLFNVQHNSQSSRRDESVNVPSSALIAFCEGCRQRVRGSKGVIHVVTRDAWTALKAWESFERKHDGGVWILSETIGLPKPAKWHLHCDACNPHYDEEFDSWCNECYWFTVDRCQTWAQLVHWTSHLSGKVWLKYTDWMNFIDAVAYGNRAVGLVADARDTRRSGV